ncbi:MAG: hypothetical protein LBR66_03490 [Candidatus Symbiothrix sp.]|jgi:hypothetical protein|nr:hypothetical protein [Candidatus Symbiothrix sp.]
MENTISDQETLFAAPVQGIEFAADGKAKSYYTVEEVFDELDREFVNFYGEYGRTLVNNRRKQWNKDGVWHFEMM